MVFFPRVPCGFRAALVAAGLAALPAGAATINELSLPGGDFSNSWAAPSVIGTGFGLVQGTGAANNFDILAFTGMAPGAQTVSLTFTAPSGIGWSYAAGGNVLYSTQPFRWAWDGTTAGAVSIGYANPSQTLSLALGPGFGGTLYLGLYFTYGQDLGYADSLPGNAAPPPAVPLPASAWLLRGALAAGAAAARRAR
ncbi:hypothetical protein, partial [Albidovulum sp.]|uniref:hypothetical protein n=1 Tax=Albidovulum sp. TaxID=1872424 RepID=UPI0039B99F20